MSVKPNPLYEVMAQDIVNNWAGKGWWPTCTVEDIFHLATDYMDLQHRRRISFDFPAGVDRGSLQEFPMNAKEFDLEMFTVGETSYRFLYAEGDWRMFDPMPDRIRRIPGA